jgi:hypothetical protein
LFLPDFLSLSLSLTLFTPSLSTHHLREKYGHRPPIQLVIVDHQNISQKGQISCFFGESFRRGFAEVLGEGIFGEVERSSERNLARVGRLAEERDKEKGRRK